MSDTLIAPITIEREIEVAAPLERVWTALTDHLAFGKWFGVSLSGPFVVGATISGTMTIEPVEGQPFLASIEAIDPKTRFAFRWVPGDCSETERKKADSETTLVEFQLEAIERGTRVRVCESGFERIPDDTRAAVMRANNFGWDFQMKNLVNYVGQRG